jgi:hypothetical protein
MVGREGDDRRCASRPGHEHARRLEAAGELRVVLPNGSASSPRTSARGGLRSTA